jgi:hypothetical protein
MIRRDAGNSPRKSATEFAALREFFSAYLHEDFRDEYGSAAGAAAAFCEDVEKQEIAAVYGDWKVWRKQLGAVAPEKAASAIRKLGGAWRPQDLNDLDQVGAVLEAGQQ